MTPAEVCPVAAPSDLDWRSKCVMLSGGILVSLALTGVTVVLPQIEAELAHSEADRLLIKLLATIVGLTMVLGAPLAGFLVDRIGVKPVLVTASILYAAAGTAGLYLTSLSGLFASRLLVGLTAAGTATMSMTLINTRLDPNARAKWMGRHVAAAMIGGIVLIPLIGLLGEIGWRWPFLLYALTLPLALIATGLDDGGQGRRARRITSRHDAVFIGWFPLRYAVLALVIGTITYLPAVYLPFVIRATGISSPTVISLVLLADSIIGAAMALVFARSRQYFSHRAAFMVCFSCAAAGMLIVALAPHFVGVVCGMVLYGFGLGWFVPNLMTTVAMHVSAEHQGRATGFTKAAHYLAAPVCVVLAEPITRTFGASGAMWIVFFLALGALTAFFLTRNSSVRNDASCVS